MGAKRRRIESGVKAKAAMAAVGATLLVAVVWLIVAQFFRLRFQFSIHSLLGRRLPCSWLAVERGQATKLRAVVEKPGGSLYDDYQVDAPGSRIRGPEPPGPRWLRRLLGDDFFANLARASLLGRHVMGADMDRLKGLGHCNGWNVIGTQLTDGGFQRSRQALPDCYRIDH